jgi:PIN domain nuclease of toxin-antitoxin system
MQTKPRRVAARIVTIIRAQALAEGIPIATGDRVFAAYGVQIVW